MNLEAYKAGFELLKDLEAGKVNYDQSNIDRCLAGLLIGKLEPDLKSVRVELTRTWRQKGKYLTRPELNELMFLDNWPEPQKSQIQRYGLSSKERDRNLLLCLITANRLRKFLEDSEW